MGSCGSRHNDDVCVVWQSLPLDIVARLCQDYLTCGCRGMQHGRLLFRVGVSSFQRLDCMQRFRTATVRYGQMAPTEERYVFHKMFPHPAASGWMVSASHCWTPHALDWNFGFHHVEQPGARMERVEEVVFVHPHDGLSCFVGIWKPVDHHFVR